MSSYYLVGNERDAFPKLVADHSNFGRFKTRLKARVDAAIGFEQKVNAAGNYLITLKWRAGDDKPITTTLQNIQKSTYDAFFAISANSALDKLALATIKKLVKYNIDQQTSRQETPITVDETIQVLRVVPSIEFAGGLNISYRRLKESAAGRDLSIKSNTVDYPRRDLGALIEDSLEDGVLPVLVDPEQDDTLGMIDVYNTVAEALADADLGDDEPIMEVRDYQGFTGRLNVGDRVTITVRDHQLEVYGSFDIQAQASGPVVPPQA